MHLTGNREVRPHPLAKLLCAAIAFVMALGWAVTLLHHGHESWRWAYPVAATAIGVGMVVSAVRQLRAGRAHGSRPSR